MAPLLSILICSIRTRAAFLNELRASLDGQIEIDIEYLVGTDDGESSIGAKRQWLLEQAAGQYIAFVDDDDILAPNYISAIRAALKDAPDVVGFKVLRMVDGQKQGHAVHSVVNRAYSELPRMGEGSRIFLRPPNHLNPVRRELALATGFKSLNWAEDRDYAERLLPHLKSEVFVDEFLYQYWYRMPHDRKLERVNAKLSTQT